MTYEYRIKCMNCSLHYSVYSWESDWHIFDPTSRGVQPNEGGYCPECGIKGNKLVFGPVERDGAASPRPSASRAGSAVSRSA
jgi:hypothetical protein